MKEQRFLSLVIPFSLPQREQLENSQGIAFLAPPLLFQDDFLGQQYPLEQSLFDLTIGLSNHYSKLSNKKDAILKISKEILNQRTVSLQIHTANNSPAFSLDAYLSYLPFFRKRNIEDVSFFLGSPHKGDGLGTSLNKVSSYVHELYLNAENRLEQMTSDSLDHPPEDAYVLDNMTIIYMLHPHEDNSQSVLAEKMDSFRSPIWFNYPSQSIMGIRVSQELGHFSFSPAVTQYRKIRMEGPAIEVDWTSNRVNKQQPSDAYAIIYNPNTNNGDYALLKNCFDEVLLKNQKISSIGLRFIKSHLIPKHSPTTLY